MPLETIDFRGLTYTIQALILNDGTVNGTSGSDWFEVLGSNNNISTNAGDDVVLTQVTFFSIGYYGYYRGDAIFYSTNPEVGNDTVDSGSGNDYVVTGGGNDLVFLGQGNDILDNSFRFGENNITAYAGQGDDIVEIISSFGGNKTVYGEQGNDNIRVLDFSENSNTDIDAGSGDDRILAFSTNVAINAGSGDDLILAGADNLTINAGSGDDFIEGTGISTAIDAGTGNDYISANGQIIAGAGDDFIGLYTVSSLLFGIVDSADGGTGNDTLFSVYLDLGDSSPQYAVMSGGGGDDTIISGISNDTIYDGEGDDLINLRGGLLKLSDGLSDYLGVEDWEIAGGGEDTVYAGKGKDTFILGMGDGFSTIYGYSPKERIDLTGLGLGKTDVSLTQNGLDTYINVGTDQIAILVGTQVNSVTFFV